MRRYSIILLAAAAIAAPLPAFAQVPETEERRVAVEQEDDDSEFPIGLLGLLGLAGLLGLRRKERDIHVDARRDKR